MSDSLAEFKNRKLPLNRAIISDILLWLFLLLLLAYGVYFFAVALPAQGGQRITLHFRNANEISKGSPVRLMGTDIGFVSDLHIRQDHVEVTVQTYPNTLEIPSGSSFNILFTGLGGSKSIEVVVPNNPKPLVNGQPVYRIEEPVTMRDTLNASIDMTQSLQQGAENIADFFGKKKPVEELQYNIQETYEMSRAALRGVTALNAASVDIRQQVHDNAQSAEHTLNDLTPGTVYAQSVTNPITARPELHRFFLTLQKFGQMLQSQEQGVLSATNMQQYLTQLNQINSQTSGNLQKINTRVHQVPIAQWLQNISTQQTRFAQALDYTDTTLQQQRWPTTLPKARQNIRTFNQRLIQWNARVSGQAASTQSAPPQPEKPLTNPNH